MDNNESLRLRQIKFVLQSVRDCGIGYTAQEVFTYLGILKHHPIHSSKYSDWENEDKIKRIIENVLNFDEITSPDKKIFDLSKETAIYLRNGIMIYLRPQENFNFDLHAIYETILRQDYFIPGQGQTVIDIGAYIGDFTIFAAHLGATVYAFEPPPQSYQQLLRNMKLMELTNVKPFNMAIVPSSCARKRAVLSYNRNCGATRVVAMSNSLSGIKCISLKQVFVENNIQKCDLLKIDCEGLEYGILESLQSDVYEKIQRIVLEFHNGCPKRLEKLRRKLESESFFVETIISAYSRVQGLLRCWR